MMTATDNGIACTLKTAAPMGSIPNATPANRGERRRRRARRCSVDAKCRRGRKRRTFSDFYPSYGATNRSADAWVPLDASYKQYQELPGLDVVTIAGINPTQLAQSFAASGTINEQEGWVQNLNPAILQNAQTQAQTALQQHIQNNLPNATVGDVIGGRKIVEVNKEILNTNLPNRPIVIGARYATLPEALQHKMTFAFGLDSIREPINPVTFPWAKLNNHKVTLSFKPATPADEQTLASFLPEGEITDPSQLPSSIPSYLITVIPEIAVDGQVVAQGYGMRLGEDLEFYYEVFRVGPGAHTYTYKVPAGSYLGVAVAGGSVSADALQSLRARLQNTQSILQSGNATNISAITRENIQGDMFHAGTLSYFGEYIALSAVASIRQNARHNLPQGYGTFGYEPNVQTFFGFPRAIHGGGVAVNVRLSYVILPRDGDMSRFRDLNLQTGLLSSALEDGVPEQMFSSPQQPAQGVSAVAALRLAAQQGQRVYHITPQNQTQVLPNLRLDGLAMTEISQALATGKEVITHTDRISVPGFTGEGYILFDPIGGAGAYKITGGSNGGFLVGLFLGILFAFSLVVFATTVTGLLAPAVLAAIAMASLGYTIMQLQDARTVSCINLGFMVGFALVLNRLIFGFGTLMSAIIGLNVAFASIRNLRECINLPPE
jgi:hypothetical protein